VRRLQGLLPICVYCKKIRDDKNYWRGVENYLIENAEVHFTHSVCPDCVQHAKGAAQPGQPAARAENSREAAGGRAGMVAPAARRSGGGRK
jgi:hypothetical protein